MKRVLLVALCLFVAACGNNRSSTSSTPTAGSAGSSGESQVVRTAFDTYIKAAVAQDGATAVSVLTESTFRVYDDFRKLALTGTEQEIVALTPGKQIVVYSMRGYLEPEVLRGASPKELVQAAIDEGMAADTSMSSDRLRKFTITGDNALGEVVLPERASPAYLRFARESGTWKFELLSALDIADIALGQVARNQGVTQDELIEQTLVSEYGAAGATEVRKPIGA
ncbi:hypothetical protein ACWGE0_21960 [Lentzea sp. NPDC054927]